MLNSYNASNIKVLKGLEAVRKRPGMYIGNTDDGTGLHHMVFELLDNSIDESLAGFCKNINVILYQDGSISVQDDGRGIPVDIHQEEGIPAVELIMTVLHSGGKFDNYSYKVSGGLHGVGVSVVNALSKKLELKIYRDGKIYYQIYCHGVPNTTLSVIGQTNKNGTYIRFWPDKKIFSGILCFNYCFLARRLQQLSFLNPGLCLSILDKIKNKNEIYINKHGIKSFLIFLSKNKRHIHENIFYFKYKKLDFYLEIGCRWLHSFKQEIYCFTNNIPQIDGGTHLSGFKSGVTRTINNFITQELKSIKNKFHIIGEDVRIGLLAVISLRMFDPKFLSQTKNKLISSEVRSLVESLVIEYLYDFFLEHPVDSKLIINKIIDSSKIREAIKKTREISRKKNMLDCSVISGKLADCQEKNPKYAEIFLVEGDSAGGSAKQGRNRKNQAVLPLKGKIINVEKSGLDKVLSSQEIITLISSLGCGIKSEIDVNQLKLSKLKYNKIIIMTDADIDGAHIRTLLLTFFYRYMTDLISNGNLYIAQPPLYKIKRGKKEFYVRNENDLLKYKLSFAFKDIDLYHKRLIILNNKKLIHNIYVYLSVSNFIFKTQSVLTDFILNKLMFFKKLDLSNVSKWLKDFIYLLNKNCLKHKITGVVCYKKNSIFYGFKFLFLKNFLKKKIFLSKKFFLSSYYNKLLSLSNALFFLNKFKKFYIYLKNKKYYFNNFYIFINFVLEFSKKYIFIQRYKGLGEMNPIQLWDTTMNPKNRVLLKVLIDDVKKANSLFKILMGDEVVPRKTFIQKYALDVVNIDI